MKSSKPHATWIVNSDGGGTPVSST